MLYAVAFIPSFVLGGVTGVMLAAAAADYQFHDTYFVVAHFHYVIIGGVVFGILAGVHFWWPKMFGKVLHETMGKISFVLFFIGFHLTFFIQHFLGLMGMPRRVYTYLPGQGLDTGNLISSIGAFFMAGAAALLVVNIIYTSIKGNTSGTTRGWTVVRLNGRSLRRRRNIILNSFRLSGDLTRCGLKSRPEMKGWRLQSL